MRARAKAPRLVDVYAAIVCRRSKSARIASAWWRRLASAKRCCGASRARMLLRLRGLPCTCGVVANRQQEAKMKEEAAAKAKEAAEREERRRKKKQEKRRKQREKKRLKKQMEEEEERKRLEAQKQMAAAQDPDMPALVGGLGAMRAHVSHQAH